MEATFLQNCIRAMSCALLLCCTQLFAASGGAQAELESVRFKINNARLTAEIADEAHERYRGLSFREALQPDSGMLFVYEQERELSFTMRYASIPLSIAFIGSDMTILEILHMSPLTDGPYPSSRPAQYALEMQQGWFRENHIQPGDKLELDLSPR